VGLVSAGGYAVLAARPSWTSAPRDVVAFVAIMSGLFVLSLAAFALARGTGRAVIVIVVFAAVFRAILVFSGLPADRRLEAAFDDLGSRAVGVQPFLLYDNDVWRYVWDGHVGSCGISPYRFSPNEIEDRTPDAECPLESDLWWDLFDRVYFPDYRTIYPPVAQIYFRVLHALAPGSVVALKAVLALLDLGTCLLLLALLRRMGRSPAEAIFYAWNPLAIKEISGSGHIDGLAIFLLTLTVFLLITRRYRSALIAFPAAVLVKLAPVLIVALVVRRAPRRWWPLLPVAGVLMCLPFARSLDAWLDATARFAGTWVFNAGPWRLLEWAQGDQAARIVAGVIVLALAAWWSFKDPGDDIALVRRGALILGVAVLLSAAVMPWYLLWVLPLAVLAPWRSWILLTALSVLSYLTYIDQTEHLWWLGIEYGVFAVACAIEYKMGTLSFSASNEAETRPLASRN
jgi:hypothetical protein